MTLFWETITTPMRQVMETFGDSQLGKNFYLAGGTALALQLGHRRSVDLDFFSAVEDIPAMRESILGLLKPHTPSMVSQAWGNLVFLAGGVRVGVYGYGYPLVAPLVRASNSHLASLPDIGLMKLDALQTRAGRKDFFDLYAICQQIPLRTLLDRAPEKYPHTRDFEAQAVRHLVYFERADQDAPVPLLQPVEWDVVKDFFRRQAVEIGRKWLE